MLRVKKDYHVTFLFVSAIHPVAKGSFRRPKDGGTGGTEFLSHILLWPVLAFSNYYLKCCFPCSLRLEFFQWFLGCLWSHIYISLKFLWHLLETSGQRGPKQRPYQSLRKGKSAHELYQEQNWRQENGIVGRWVTINLSRQHVLHHSSSDTRSGL